MLDLTIFTGFESQEAIFRSTENMWRMHQEMNDILTSKCTTRFFTMANHRVPVHIQRLQKWQDEIDGERFEPPRY